MSEEFEKQLRRALRPLEAPEGFAERVLRALPSRPTLAPLPARASARPAPRPGGWRRFSAPTALAASLIVAVLFGRHVAVERADRERAAGLAASQELMQALRVTSQKLDLAYQAVNRPPAARAAEENRS
jgi:hypothetical protein